jgi:hypothetical protein
MADRDIALEALEAIGELLIEMFQDTVRQPLPPLVLQLTRRLHETTRGDAEDEEDAPLRPKRANLFNREGAMDQLSFASLDFAAKKKRTKRDVFLAEMAAVVPWGRSKR